MQHNAPPAAPREPREPRERPERDRWHVGKEVPLALIFGMLVQTAAAIWWARGQVAMDENLNQRVSALERERDAIRGAERMAVIEAAIADIRRSNERLELLVQQALNAHRK